MAESEKELEKIDKQRLEAFSDGVMAIIITIMVLEIRVPEGPSLHDLSDVAPKIIAYLVSFIFVGIYWNNHHHLLRAAQRISSSSMWANLHLLFWLSLTPFVTAWVGDNIGEPWPVAFYGFIGLGGAIAYYLLAKSLSKQNPGSKIEAAMTANTKDLVSQACFLSAIPLAFVSAWISYVLMVAVLALWIIPDRRLT